MTVTFSDSFLKLDILKRQGREWWITSWVSFSNPMEDISHKIVDDLPSIIIFL